MLIRVRHFFAKISTLQIAIGFSVLVHVLLIAVRFVDPESFNRVFKDASLDIILVNAKSNDKLDEHQTKVQAVAQYKLVGGGEAANGLASSPLVSSQITDLDATAEQAQVDALQDQQMRMLTEIKNQMATLPKPAPKVANSREREAQKQKRKHLLKLLASIEKRINEENARPKKRYISPATRQEAYALYYDALRRKIESKGTENFPNNMGTKLYGELTMLITVNHNGQVLSTEVVNGGSGNRMLDVRAQAIAQSSAPFGHFTTNMRRTADQLVVASRFKFTREGALETTLAAQ